MVAGFRFGGWRANGFSWVSLVGFPSVPDRVMPDDAATLRRREPSPLTWRHGSLSSAVRVQVCGGTTFLTEDRSCRTYDSCALPLALDFERFTRPRISTMFAAGPEANFEIRNRSVASIPAVDAHAISPPHSMPTFWRVPGSRLT